MFDVQSSMFDVQISAFQLFNFLEMIPPASTKFNFQGRTVSITGVGSYVPATILTNADLEKKVDTSDEWITSRTGIKERRICADGEFTSDLAAKAALRAMEKAKITADKIDLIIVATITP